MAKRKTEIKTDFIPEIQEATTFDLGNEFSQPADVEPQQIGDVLLDSTDEPKQKRKYTKRKNASGDGDLPFIDGEMILMFLDLIIPIGISFSNNWLTGEKMSPDDLMMSEKQKQQLKKLADRFAEKIDIDVNPVLALTVGMGTIYAGNFFATKNKNKWKKHY